MRSNLDYNTCTMQDVVARSVSMHPSLFAEAMRNAQRIHSEAGATFGSRIEAADSAYRAAADCRAIAELVEASDALDDPETVAAAICTTLGRTIQAFTQASRLVCITPALRSDIAARWKE